MTYVMKVVYWKTCMAELGEKKEEHSNIIEPASLAWAYIWVSNLENWNGGLKETLYHR